jgi:protein MpaA
MQDVQYIPDWAKSAAGHNIPLYMSGEISTFKMKPILIVGGVHGDEPEGVWLSEHCLEWLKSNPVSVPWLLVTCLNPDGFLIRERTNSRKVDLNRNFPSSNWSTEHSKARYYPGPHPQSEPEVQALVRLIDKANPQLIIHCHSWKPCVVYTGEPGLRDSERLGRSSGYQVQPDIGYPTPGSLGEYGWKDKKIPVICIEENEPMVKEEIWPRFANGFKEIFSDPNPRI